MAAAVGPGDRRPAVDLRIYAARRDRWCAAHIHTNADEYAYVVAGEFSPLVHDEVARAEPGSLAVLTRGRLHAFWNASDREAKALFIVSEGGFETLFRYGCRQIARRAARGTGGGKRTRCA